MPQIIIKGVSRKETENLAIKCCPKLGEICSCPSDWFVFDRVESEFYDESGRIPHWPVVTVWWFERPRSVRDRVAKLLNDELKSMGYPGSQISFHIFDYPAYYEDGEHF